MHQYRRWLTRGFMAAALLIGLVLVQASPAKAQASPEDHALISGHSWTCMDLPGVGFLQWLVYMDGAPIVQSQCFLGTRQTWKIRPLDIHGNYQVVNALSGKCLDVANGSTAHGATAIQLSCNGATSQMWRRFFIRSQSLPFFGQIPLYGLQNAKSLDWLTVTNAGTVIQDNFTGGGPQLWGFFNLQSGRFAGV
jgi:Ricin-type beta-trefoil lectin domain-like